MTPLQRRSAASRKAAMTRSRMRAARGEVLTQRQAELLALIERGLAMGACPRLKDLCAALGIRSHGAVANMITTLALGGFVETQGGSSRVVRVVKHPSQSRETAVAA